MSTSPTPVPLTADEFEELEAWLRQVVQDANGWAERLEASGYYYSMRQLDAIATTAGNAASAVKAAHA